MKLAVAAAAAAFALGGGVAWQQLPAIGAGALLHPSRSPDRLPPPAGCVMREFAGAGVTLRGWICDPAGPARATIVYLHGIADHRDSAAGVIERFRPRGFRVVAYDSRAHGESGGDACTYGFFETDDLHRVIDSLPAAPVVLIGTSLGAAVALQEAADDRRVSTVVAAETFSDLRTVATERAPLFFTRGTIERAFALAESQAHFRVEDVSPLRAARRIDVPVLLIHGAADRDTPPAHSQRVRAALKGSSELIIVPDARHNQSLSGAEIWKRIDVWIAGAVPNRTAARKTRSPQAASG